MEHATLKYSRKLHNMLFGLVFGCLTVLVVYFLIHTYYIQYSSSKQKVCDGLKAITATAALQINGDNLQELAMGYPNKGDVASNTQNPIYDDIYQQLKQVAAVNQLQSVVYLLEYNQQRHAFEFLVSTADVPFWRHRYTKFPEQLVQQMETGGILDVYESENGLWLSAFTPVRNSKGQVVALLQADQEFTAFKAQAQRDLLSDLLIALFTMLVIGTVLYVFLRRMLVKDKALMRELADHNEEIRAQNEEIEAQSTVIQQNNNQLEQNKQVIEQKNKRLEALNRLLDRKVRQRTEALEEANTDLSNFLYRSSHDMRGPIATLRGLCHLAGLEVNTPEGQAYLKKIANTTNKLDETLARINLVYEVKSHQLTPKPLRPAEVANKVWENNSPMVNGSLMKLINEIPESLSFDVDPYLLETAINELARNAIMYKGDGSDPYLKLTGYTKADDRCFILTAQDNGPGIADTEEDKLFHMFHRGCIHGSGTGLGLYIANNAVKRMHGNISYLGRTDNHTTFQIEVPLVDQAMLASDLALTE